MVQNAYAADALLAMASLERDSNDLAQEAAYTRAATALRANMLQHLVNATDGSWYCERAYPPNAQLTACRRTASHPCTASRWERQA